MTIHLPETSSTSNEMGVSFDTCLYISIEFMHSDMRAMFKMHCTPFLDLSCPLWFIRLIHNTTRISRSPPVPEDYDK